MIDPATLQQAATILAQGGIVAIPTDTVYGIAAHPDCHDAVARLYTIKGRPDRKPIPLLVNGPEALTRRGITLTPVEQRWMDAFWPGALTIIVTHGDNTEGVRMPDQPDTLELLARCGGTLRATSANASGEPPARNAAEVRAALDDGVDLVLDGGPARQGKASTVARWTGTAITVVREGTVTRAQLEALANP